MSHIFISHRNGFYFATEAVPLQIPWVTPYTSRSHKSIYDGVWSHKKTRCIPTISWIFSSMKFFNISKLLARQHVHTPRWLFNMDKVRSDICLHTSKLYISYKGTCWKTICSTEKFYISLFLMMHTNMTVIHTSSILSTTMVFFSQTYNVAFKY